MEDISIAVAFRQADAENECREVEEALWADGNVLEMQLRAMEVSAFLTTTE